MVSSSLVQVMPIAPASLRRVADTSAPGGGARSWGSRDTASPVVSTLPVSASRSVSGVSEVLASRDPATVTERAGATATGVTTISAPSVTPTLDRVTSSTSTTPGGPAGSPAAASAALTREPVSLTASQARSPSASITSGCSRTTPRRVSNADGDRRAVSEITASSLRRVREVVVRREPFRRSSAAAVSRVLPPASSGVGSVRTTTVTAAITGGARNVSGMCGHELDG